MIIEDKKNKKIKGMVHFKEDITNERIINERIEGIKRELNYLKDYLEELNDYRERWTDFDVVIVCWLLAHDPDELKFWK